MTPTGGSHGKPHRTTKILSHAWRRGGRVAARGARAAGREAADHRVLGRRHAVRLEPVGSRLCAATTRTRLPGLRIEIGVAAAGIDGAVPDADIRETGGVIGSDRYVSGDVRHPVVNAVV